MPVFQISAQLFNTTYQTTQPKNLKQSTISLSSPMSQDASYTLALLRTLKAGGVRFLRYTSVDACNNVRAKIKPVDYLLKQQLQTKNRSISVLNNQVSIAAVCFAGLPSYADVMVPETGLTAEHVLVLQPDLSTLRILPNAPQTARVVGALTDQYDATSSSPLDSRAILQRLVQHASDTMKLTMSVGVELEFCLVDAATGAFLDDSTYANAGILNDQQDFIEDLYSQLEAQEIAVELIHAESGPGQMEVVLQYVPSDPVLAADQVLWAQETIRSVARQHGKKALFLPKYSSSQAGNGMHVHLSINKLGCNGQLEPMFSVQDQPATMSPEGSSFLEGILQHLPALIALSAPTVNSQRRIGKGCWTGSQVGWALEDKESGLRVCSNLRNQEWDHLEYKFCDAAGNLYLTLAALFACGLEGIQNQLILRPALNSSSGGETSQSLPTSVEQALDALEVDELLTSDRVLGSTLAKAYVALRRNEAARSNGLTLEEEVQEALRRA